MPIIPQEETIVQYITNSAQLIYTFAFYAPLSSDIDVYYQAANATPIPSSDILVLGSDYNVTFNTDPITGGFITLLFTPTTGFYLTINRNVVASLDTNFANASTFSGIALDAALDRLLLLIQQNKNYILERNLSYIINTYLPNAQPFTQLPPLAQNELWIGSGAGVVAAPIADNPSASVLQAQLANNAVGTDGSRLVGYYDSVNSVATTVHDFLENIVTFLQNNVFQPGDMKDFAGATLQTGWLLCDGTAVSRTTYAALFTAIGVLWGIGDGTTTFNLPDFRRSVAVGSGGSSTVTLGNVVGNVGGSEINSTIVNHTHTLSLPQVHTLSTNGNNFVRSGDVQTDTFIGTTSNPSGGVASSNIIQPSAIVTKIIKY